MRSQQEGVQNLAVVVVDHEERLQLLEKIVLRQGRALVKLRAKYEGGTKLRRQTNPPTKRPTELSKVEKTTLWKDSLKTKSAISDSEPSKSRQPLRKGSSEVRKGSGNISAAETDIRIRSLLERLNGQVQGPDQRRSKGVSVSLVADTSVTGSGKAEGASRTNSSKIERTSTKSGSTTKKVAVKRKAAGQLEGEVGCGGHIREPGGGKAAKLLLKVGTPPQTIPGGKGYWTETGKRSRETKEPSRVRGSGGAIQRADPGAGQPVRHSGHASRASSHSQGQGSVKSPARGQGVAGNLDTSSRRTEGGLSKQTFPPKRSEQ